MLCWRSGFVGEVGLEYSGVVVVVAGPVLMLLVLMEKWCVDGHENMDVRCV